MTSFNAEAGSVSFYGEINPYSVRTMAAKIEKQLWSGDNDIVLHLESNGGEIPSALALANLLRSITESGRRVVTYASSYCESACTIIFAAGSVRIARPDAEFYFHSVGVQGAGKKRNEVQKTWSEVWLGQVGLVDERLADELNNNNITVGWGKERTYTAKELIDHGYSFVSYLK